MNEKEFIKGQQKDIERAAILAARDGGLDKDTAQMAIDGATWVAPEKTPDRHGLFAVWVPRGTVPGRWHRTVDYSGSASSTIVWGRPDEWEYAGKLYVGRKAADGTIPVEISAVSAAVSAHDAPASVRQALWDAYGRLIRTNRGI